MDYKKTGNLTIKEYKREIFLMLLCLLLLAGWFYWFQYRPVKIRSYCDWYVRWEDGGPKCKGVECYDAQYKSCLHGNGL